MPRKAFQPSSSNYREDCLLDDQPQNRDLVQVVDSDSSQTIAILDSLDGHTMVIQGPPGTGKSQTIVNLIAGAVAQGKRVLFVSEKMAALDVVKRRLDRVRLGSACLELQSNRTNKKTIIEELRRTALCERQPIPRSSAELVRDFSLRDVGHPRVVIISSAVARHYFPGQNPVGRNITVVHDPRPFPFGDDRPYEIIGVAGDVKPFELRDAPFPTFYFDMFQVDHVFDQFQLRTSAHPAAIAETARRLVREVLPDMPVKRLTTLAAQVDSNIVPERLIATLSEFFGGLGAVLAGIGIYGLLAFSVARRTNEIGVRMALGATAGDVSRLVLRDTVRLLCVGLVAGSFLVVWGRPLAASLIQDLKPESAGPLALANGATAVALLASYVPTRRATRVDPMVALRHE